jgi:hypothetical protein
LAAKVAIPRGDVACPVEAVKAWRETAGITEGALFRRVWNKRAQRVGAQRLTARIVADVVKAGVTRLALDPATFGAHSLRSGLVTTAIKRGVNLLKICDQTGHKAVKCCGSIAATLSFSSGHTRRTECPLPWPPA